jgi:hypothetical protein
LKKHFISFYRKWSQASTCGVILVTIADKHKETAIPLLKRFSECGFSFIATSGTQKKLTEEDFLPESPQKLERVTLTS